MRVVVSLGFCGIIPGSSTIIFGNMVGEMEWRGICVWRSGCWGVGGVSESDMRKGGDNFLIIFGVM